MDLFQILAQQGSRPDRGVISHLAGIGIDDLGNQGVDDPQSRGGTTLTRTVREAGMEIDRRRMRANVVLETENLEPFLEDEWVGATLVFGDGEPTAAVAITSRDERCVMVNIDPDTGEKDARVMKAVVRLNDNYAGVYGTVVRAGVIHVGQTVGLVR